jgi:hypothetical protein
MDSIIAFILSLNTQNWLTVIAIGVALIFGSFTALNYLAGRRERKLRTYESTSQIKATINGTRYYDGWRSVQLHVEAVPDQEQNFKYANWRIERARLLHPSDAELARAENDDYASGAFYPENPVRLLEGKAEGRPQRFALEFFIRFRGEERGRRARFKVTFSHIKLRRRRTVRVWATVPENAS